MKNILHLLKISALLKVQEDFHQNDSPLLESTLT